MSGPPEGNAEFSQWKGLFDWSMKFQDGTFPTEFGEMDTEKKEWLEQVMQYYTQDFGKRMTDISQGLIRQDDSEDAVAEKEELLEELTDICESIDFARDLGKVGGLPCVMSLLKSPNEGLRWRAAELLAVCSQNNPPVQKEFLDEGVQSAMMELLDDTCASVRVKALLCLSAMVRQFVPGAHAARELGLVPKLCSLPSADGCDVRVHRKCLQLLVYFCKEFPEDCKTTAEALGPKLPSGLLSDDIDMVRWSLELTAILLSDSSSRTSLLEVTGVTSAIDSVLESLEKKAVAAADEVREELESARRVKKLVSSPPPARNPAPGGSSSSATGQVQLLSM